MPKIKTSELTGAAEGGVWVEAWVWVPIEEEP